MGIKISGLNELRERLERLRPEEIMARALAEQAERMAARVREGLGEQPGAAGHDEPWLRTGALRDSVGAQADGLQAVVGSSDPAAVPQELGTARMPPRPFLAPVAAAMGEAIARAVGAAVMAALRGDSSDAGNARVDLCGDGPDGGEPLYGGATAGGGAPASTSPAKAPGTGGQAHPAAHRSNTGGFNSSDVHLASDSGGPPEDLEDAPPADRQAVEEGLETPGQARAHALPQVIPGLNSPTPTIPRLGGGKADGNPSALPSDKPASTPIGRRGNPIEVAPGTNQPMVINGRLYSGHALDRMQGRGIPPSAVEEAIQHGQPSSGNTSGTMVHTGNNGVVVVTGSNGQVITVITR